MCGIAGIVNFHDSVESLEEKSKAMISAITHRGPDSQNIWSYKNCGLVLGHRRLSIQDLSHNGLQPMQSSSGNSTIVFNGEIYNFLSIRQELLSTGLTLKSSSDTEVLLEAIELWGIEKSISKCKGMFAFALWDNQTGQLHLVRDPIGEKPLYYGLIDKQFIFASELKAFFAIINPKSLDIDNDALGSYLRYGYISAPHSVFKQIKKLEPGHLLTVPIQELKKTNALMAFFDGASKSIPYWNLDSIRQKNIKSLITSEAHAVNGLDQLLNSIINEQSISDVPLGTFLSGGIDSSIVSAILQANSSSPIDTFTIGFHEKSFNEALHAKSVAQHIGSKHHEVYISSKDAMNIVPDLSTIYDEPFADSSQIPTFLVSQLAKKNVTVCLSGDGGDELFAGYNRYTMPVSMFKKTQSMPSLLQKLSSTFLTSVPPKYWDKAYELCLLLFRKTGSANFGLKVHKLGELFKHNSLDTVYRYLSGYWQDPELLINERINEPLLTSNLSFDENFIESAMLWDQKWYLPGDNLAKSDRASMACSLEMRLPLLDRELIEYSWRIPNNMKVRGNVSKWLLRQVLYRYVPQDLIDRPKMGFSVPVAQWIRKDLKSWSQELLSRTLLKEQAIFNPELLGKIHNEHLTGKFDHSHKLWTVLMFQAWYQKYVGSNDYRT